MSGILLLRHAESIKNVVGKFSSAADSDALTELGRAHLHAEVVPIVAAAQSVLPGLSIVVCSPSRRAVETAEQMERQGLSVKRDSLLSSHVVTQTAGLTESELCEKFPESSRYLKEYRHGLRSSSTIPFVRDSLDALRERAREALLSYDEVMFVAHRSFLTACLMEAAAASGAIERTHYGFVPLDYLRLSLIQKGQGGQMNIGFVNQPAALLSRGLGVDGWPEAQG